MSYNAHSTTTQKALLDILATRFANKDKRFLVPLTVLRVDIGLLSRKNTQDYRLLASCLDAVKSGQAATVAGMYRVNFGFMGRRSNFPDDTSFNTKAMTMRGLRDAAKRYDPGAGADDDRSANSEGTGRGSRGSRGSRSSQRSRGSRGSRGGGRGRRPVTAAAAAAAAAPPQPPLEGVPLAISDVTRLDHEIQQAAEALLKLQKARERALCILEVEYANAGTFIDAFQERISSESAGSRAHSALQNAIRAKKDDQQSITTAKVATAAAAQKVAKTTAKIAAKAAGTPASAPQPASTPAPSAASPQPAGGATPALSAKDVKPKHERKPRGEAVVSTPASASAPSAATASPAPAPTPAPAPIVSKPVVAASPASTTAHNLVAAEARAKAARERKERAAADAAAAVPAHGN